MESLNGLIKIHDDLIKEINAINNQVKILYNTKLLAKSTSCTSINLVCLSVILFLYF